MNEQNYTYYRTNYRRILGLIIILVWVALGQVFVLSYLGLRVPQPDYYVTSDNGNTIPVQPLDRPIVSDKYVVEWSALAIRSAYNLDFVHWHDQLAKTAIYFTPEAFQRFKDALDASKVTEQLESSKLISSAVVTSSPVILNKGTLNGRYFWKIKMPLLVTYTSASSGSKSSLIVTLLVSRVPSLETPKGIQIISLNVS